MLLDHLGIGTLFAVVGGSLGGMQVLQWAVSYPERVFAALPIAAATRHSAQNIAFHEVGRQAVMADPDWRQGRYFAEGTNPRRGLAVARMGAHITSLSDAALHRKFGRRFQDRDNPTFSFDADFQVESYLRHQGITFVERFDANSYLYLTRAMDYFDIAADFDGVLANAFKDTPTRFCVISFTSDWLFPTSDSRAIVHALNAGRARAVVRRGRCRQGTRRFPAGGAGLFAIVAVSSKVPPRRAGSSRVREPIDRQDHKPSCSRALGTTLRWRTPRARRRRASTCCSLPRWSSVARARCRLRRWRAAAAVGEARGRRARHRLSREGERGLARASRDQGDATPILPTIPTTPSTTSFCRDSAATRQPRRAGTHARIGRHAIVSFPNFGHWQIRLQVGVAAICHRPIICPTTGGTPQHSCAIKIPPPVRRRGRQDRRRWRSTHGVARCAQCAVVVSEPDGRQPCFSESPRRSRRLKRWRFRPALQIQVQKLGFQDQEAPDGLRRLGPPGFAGRGGIRGMGIARLAYTFEIGRPFKFVPPF
jgi:pimeloyl-ACP methyl ester carboxylesterase